MEERVLVDGKIYTVIRKVNGYVHYGDCIGFQLISEKIAIFAKPYHKKLVTRGVFISCQCFQNKKMEHQNYIETDNGTNCKNCESQITLKCCNCDHSKLKFEWYNETSLHIECLNCQRLEETERQSKIVREPIICGNLLKTSNGYVIDGLPCKKCGIIKYNKDHSMGSCKGRDNIICVCGEKIHIPFSVADKISKGSVKSWFECPNCKGTHQIVDCYLVSRYFMNLDSWEDIVVSCGGKEIDIKSIVTKDDLDFWKSSVWKL
jgi:hypothetical protein